MPPREGSKVRIIGLKNPDLNGKIGHINSYSRDGERVMVQLSDGRQGLVKVKPKQIEAVYDAQAGGGRPGLHQRNTSMRSSSRDNRSRNNGGGRRVSNERGAQNFNSSAQSGMRSSDNFRDNGSQASASGDGDIMETLRSADAMFELADTSGDGAISQEEFEFYMKKHTNHDQAMIRECFLSIDVDRNGDITRDEVRSAFIGKRRKLKGDDYPVSKKDLEDELLQTARDADKLFDEADFDGGGTLSKREFELYMKRHTTHSEAAINTLFDRMDIDRDGNITREEVRKAHMEHQQGGGKQSLADLLGVEDDEMAEIEDDVYSMYFLAPACSQAYWFALFIFVLKFGLIVIIAIDLYSTGYFPSPDEVPGLVKLTQFLLLPVNVAVQEELITTFFIYANLKWSKCILELHPGASKGHYHFANSMRFVDGMAFLAINTTLMIQATTVIGAFLNFAALQFLSEIDNVALTLARDGYLSESLESVAGDVLLMKLPKNHNHSMQVMDSVCVAILYVITLIVWIAYMYVL